MARFLLIAFVAIFAPTSAWSLTVAGFGDSLTEGGDYLAYLSGDWQKLDLGRAGETTRRGEQRFMELLPTLEADALVVLEGTNDVRYPNFAVEASVTSLTAIVDGALDAGLAVVLAAPPVISAHPLKHSAEEASVFNERLGALAAQLSAEARAREIPFVDLYDTFSKLSDPAAHFLDGVHPNLAGRQLMAQEIEAGLYIAVIPEPDTLLLLGVGLAVLAAPRRRC